LEKLLGIKPKDSCDLASNKFCRSQSTVSTIGTLFAKSGKVGKSTDKTTLPSTTLSAKTEKIGNSANAEANIDIHGLFSKAAKTSLDGYLHSKSGKAYFFMKETEASHSMSANSVENDRQSFLIESKSGKALRAVSNSKSQKKKKS
jgi:hypothetical protein